MSTSIYARVKLPIEILLSLCILGMLMFSIIIRPCGGEVLAIVICLLVTGLLSRVFSISFIKDKTPHHLQNLIHFVLGVAFIIFSSYALYLQPTCLSIQIFIFVALGIQIIHLLDLILCTNAYIDYTSFSEEPGQ